MASEIFRSKWRDMNPSRCLIRLRSSQVSAGVVSAGELILKRPGASASSSAPPNFARNAAISSSALS